MPVFPTSFAPPTPGCWIAALLECFAVPFDQNGGFTEPRAMLGVELLGTMVFSIGCRQHSAACVSYLSPRVMFYALALLNLGCFYASRPKFLFMDGASPSPGICCPFRRWRDDGGCAIVFNLLSNSHAAAGSSETPQHGVIQEVF